MSIERSSVEGDRTLAVVAYVLHLVGAVAGITSIAGLIINYVKRDDYDELFDSHHAWMIRSFWWAILWCVLGVVTIVIVIGWAILFVVVALVHLPPRARADRAAQRRADAPLTRRRARSSPRAAPLFLVALET